MQMSFLQGEQNANRLRWILVLVDSTDGVTGKTGQTGTVQISKNGGAPAASTNSLVEVDSVNMPGHYYVQLATGEVDTLGMISIYYKASSTLAFHDRGFVTYQDPFAASGVLVTGNGGRGGSEKTLKVDYKKIREIVKEEVAAIEIPEAQEIAIPDNTEKLDKILDCVEGMETDLSPVLDAIGELPAPKDYAGDFAKIAGQVKDFGTAKVIDNAAFAKTAADFMSKMQVATKDINGSLEEVAAIKAGFADLQKLMDAFKATLAEQGDMDKRFDAMNSASNNKKVEMLTKQITELAVQIVNLRFDLKEKKLLNESK